MVAGEKVSVMKTGSSTTWIILLVVLAALAIWSGWWVLDLAFKIILYVVLAAVAVWAVMMLMRAVRGGGHHPAGV